MFAKTCVLLLNFAVLCSGAVITRNKKESDFAASTYNAIVNGYPSGISFLCGNVILRIVLIIG